jgi:hypothetical protein
VKDFIRKGGRLRPLPLPARLVYSVFLGFTVAGLAATLWLTEDMVGLDLRDAASYYAGEAAPEPALPSDPEEGPAIDFPDEGIQLGTGERIARRKLLEVTHFHLFSMPVYLLILCHLYVLSRASERAKVFWVGVGTLSTATHILAPWVAAAGSAGSIWLYGLSGSGLAAAYAVMSLVPLWEMWAPAPKEHG